MTKDEKLKIIEIAKRADEEKLTSSDRLTLIMDIEVAHEQFGLRLDELLTAEKQDFAHDIIGIQTNINRQSKTIENFFLPRYSN